MVQHLVTTFGVKWYVYGIHNKSKSAPRPRGGSSFSKVGLVDTKSRKALRFQPLFGTFVAEKENGLWLVWKDGNTNQFF